MFSLAGKKALVIGIANSQSIAYGCAKAFREQGANLAVTYLNEKAEPFVRPLAEELGADLVLPLDVTKDGQFGALFDSIRQHWGRIDICVHSIAFCPREDLHARVMDCSRAGFATAMDVSVYSFISMVRGADELLERAAERAPTHHLATVDRSVPTLRFSPAAKPRTSPEASTTSTADITS